MQKRKNPEADQDVMGFCTEIDGSLDSELRPESRASALRKIEDSAMSCPLCNIFAGIFWRCGHSRELLQKQFAQKLPEPSQKRQKRDGQNPPLELENLIFLVENNTTAPARPKKVAVELPDDNVVLNPGQARRLRNDEEEANTNWKYELKAYDYQIQALLDVRSYIRTIVHVNLLSLTNDCESGYHMLRNLQSRMRPTQLAYKKALTREWNAMKEYKKGTDADQADADSGHDERSAAADDNLLQRSLIAMQS
ncbi:hypothetical protein VE03_10163 [Pseudogymnoascus sp. 23342-1-I1]|nr:hypothetical protein VE03_10163 [Pseudogymnoascus sp. 23342-1-I1]